jgi:hypothetical protein
MSQQTIAPVSVPTGTTQPHLSKAVLSTVNTPAPPGPDFALTILESALIGGEVSDKTNQLIHQQITQLVTPATPPTDTLNLLTALIIGSPEFQLR